MDGRFHGFGDVIERALADAVDAFIGRDFCEEPVFPGIPRDVSFDGSNAHKRAL